MGKRPAIEPAVRQDDPTPGGLAEAASDWSPASGGSDKARFEAVMAAAEHSGLLKGKSGRIGGRVSPALVAQAKRRTGIASDTDLIPLALANVALEDDFADAFRDSRGKVDPELKLGF